MIHCSHHPSLLQLLSDPSFAPSVAPSIAPWSTTRIICRSFYCSLIHRLQLPSHNPSLLLLLFDPSVALSIAPRSIAHRSFYCSLIHRLHHPLLLLMFADQPLLLLLPDQPLTPYIAPPFALWSISFTIRRSFCRPLVTSQHILYYCTYYSFSFTCTVHCMYYTYCTLYI